MKIEIHLLMAMLTGWCIFGGIVVIFLPEYGHTHASDHELDAEER